MSGGTQENAMTEIALAMAMGFFSVMVLTAMSMGVSVSSTKNSTPSLVMANIADSSPTPGGAVAEKLTSKDVLVVVDGKQFLGSNGKPINLGEIDSRKRIVLAVNPDLSMAEIIEVRRKIPARRLVVTPLDDNWSRALRERQIVP